MYSMKVGVILERDTVAHRIGACTEAVRGISRCPSDMRLHAADIVPPERRLDRFGVRKSARRAREALGSSVDDRGVLAMPRNAAGRATLHERSLARRTSSLPARARRGSVEIPSTDVTHAHPTPTASAIFPRPAVTAT